MECASHNNEIKNKKFTYFFNSDVYRVLKKDMLKSVIIDISSYQGMMTFLEQESIIIDEENLNIIEEELKNKINEAFDLFETIFIKLNFSSASDANFLVNDLRCYNLNDVLLLLKGSDKICENLRIFTENLKEKEADNGNHLKSELYLILKQWYKIDPRYEFRIFLQNSKIIGICQRHLNYFFDYKVDEIEEIRGSIISLVNKVFNYEEEHIQDLKNRNFFMDVLFLPKYKKVKIIDILTEEHRQLLIEDDNQGEISSGDYYFLLFPNSWESIMKTSGSDNQFSFKVITKEEETFDSIENLNKWPLEIIGDENRGNIGKIIELLQNTNV